MILLKNILHFSTFGYNLIEDCSINTFYSIFPYRKNSFSQYQLSYFAEKDLVSIILKWNDIKEVAVSNPIVRNH